MLSDSEVAKSQCPLNVKNMMILLHVHGWSLAAKWLRIWCSCHEISEACSPKIVRKQVKLPWVEYPPMILIHYTFSTKRVNSHLMVLRNIYFLLRVKKWGPPGKGDSYRKAHFFRGY